MTKFELGEDTTHFSGQNLVTAPFDVIFSERPHAVFAVDEEVIVLPRVSVGRRRQNTLQGMVDGTDLLCC